MLKRSNIGVRLKHTDDGKLREVHPLKQCWVCSEPATFRPTYSTKLLPRHSRHVRARLPSIAFSASPPPPPLWSSIARVSPALFAPALLRRSLTRHRARSTKFSKLSAVSTESLTRCQHHPSSPSTAEELLARDLFLAQVQLAALSWTTRQLHLIMYNKRCCGFMCSAAP